MKETLTHAVALLGLVLPCSGAVRGDDKRSRIPEGWDFGSMPEAERNADWS